jgi:hypothetical protein
MANVDVLGHVEGHGAVRQFYGALIVFILSRRATQAMVNIMHELAEVGGSMSCPS